MINIALSITLVVVFKTVFLRLFGSQRKHGSHSVLTGVDRLSGDRRSVLNKSQVTAH